MAEIADNQLTALQRAQKLVDALWSDKDQGAKIRAKAKELFPDIRTVDEAAEPVVAPLRAALEEKDKQLKELGDKVSAFLKEKEDKELEASFETKLSKARSKYNLTDEGMQKVLDRMKETKNFTDVDGAAAAVLFDTPAPKPTSGPSWMPQSINLFGSQEREEKWESLHNNPQKYMDDQLREFVRDPDAYVRETFGNAA